MNRFALAYARAGTALVAGTLLVTGMSGVASAIPAASTVSPVGIRPTVANDARPEGNLAATTPVSLSVSLKPANPNGLTSLATAVSNPKSPQYRHFLSQPQVQAEFGAPPATIAAVRAWLASQHLTVGATTGDGLIIPATGTASAVSSAFKTPLAHYKLASGREVYANTSAPVAPATLASGIQGVFGLNNLAVPQSNMVRSKAVATRANSVARPSANSVGPVPCAAASDAGGGFNSYTADQLASAYGFTSGYAAGYQGAGVNIGLVELADYHDSDINAYKSCYGLSSSVARVNVDGGTSTGNGTSEAELDVEDVIGLAPTALVSVYVSPNTFQALFDLYGSIVNDDSTQVNSTSWGSCEQVLNNAFGSSWFTGTNTLFQDMALQGQSFFAASGDTGSEACYQSTVNDPTPDNALSVGDPASQPFVTGVGGTSLALPANTESTWNNGPTIQGQRDGGSGGGGLSGSDIGGGSFPGWARPTYQSGTGAREVPDVSADADPNGGYVIFCTDTTDCPLGFSDPNFPGWSGTGGTSAAAPLWAAFTALAVQKAGGPLGSLNPTLYPLHADLRDVTTGNNDFTGTNGGQFAAATGYDLATGLGSPNGSTLLNALAGSVPSRSGAYTGVTPFRVLDTRNGTGRNGQIGPNSSFNVQITGAGSPVPTGALAVVLNVTVTGPTAPSYLTISPQGHTLASNLNFLAGETVPNLVEVGLSKTGSVSIYNAAGSTDVIADIEGYVAPVVGHTGLFEPVTPARILDTRVNVGHNGPVGQTPINLKVTGHGGVPASGVSAVVLNVTVTNPTAPASYLTAWPADVAQPLASNLNFTAGDTVPNRVIVPVAQSGLNAGSISIYNAFGSTDVIADVGGWFTNASGPTTGDIFVPAVSPIRMLDTRFGPGPVGQVTTAGLNILVAAGGYVPNNADAIVANVTVANPSSASYLTVYPGTASLPLASDLNFVGGQVVPNLTVVKLGSNGSLNYYNGAGSTDVITDVAGWYIPV